MLWLCHASWRTLQKKEEEFCVNILSTLAFQVCDILNASTDMWFISNQNCLLQPHIIESRRQNNVNKFSMKIGIGEITGTYNHSWAGKSSNQIVSDIYFPLRLDPQIIGYCTVAIIQQKECLQ